MRRFFKRNKPDLQLHDPVLQTDGTPVTILIVDDSPTETHILKGILERGGYRVITADNGERGVSTAKAANPNLILMDVVMPGLNGFQATRQLSQSPETADIPIIMVSTKGQETDRAWGMRQGARDYVVKPVSPDELLDKISVVLNV
ncbi:MAG: response regulator [Chromatiaceae bacterium]|nr:response regulator [Gammaproteobacteria bacterium]MCP5427376.1 response regulator [Chromatiaceae bacterium]MCB1871214.1 response regulator [Gammaproteobacteria bacterium]MCB1879648.1 response regulator [Gammaproteobacteria bacterium]MCB1902896.1 response regulator [Gammaproteobacteria bacterium]